MCNMTLLTAYPFTLAFQSYPILLIYVRAVCGLPGGGRGGSGLWGQTDEWLQIVREGGMPVSKKCSYDA